MSMFSFLPFSYTVFILQTSLPVEKMGNIQICARKGGVKGNMLCLVTFYIGLKGIDQAALKTFNSEDGSLHAPPLKTSQQDR